MVLKGATKVVPKVVPRVVTRVVLEEEETDLEVAETSEHAKSIVVHSFTEGLEDYNSCCQGLD